jgi:hypothetical protein
MAAYFLQSRLSFLLCRSKNPVALSPDLRSASFRRTFVPAIPVEPVLVPAILALFLLTPFSLFFSFFAPVRHQVLPFMSLGRQLRQPR